MRKAVVWLSLFLVSCQSLLREPEFVDAQRLVEQTVSKHEGVVRLTIHAVPTGETRSRIIACNIRETLGKASDPEDLEAMRTKKGVVLREGDNLDVTAPIVDKAGNAVAATGITLACPTNAKEEALVEKAKAIAQELSKGIQEAKKPLW